MRNPRSRRAVAAVGSTLPKLSDADFAGKTVLVRADLNTPLNNGQVADDFRIRAFVPTLEYLVAQGCKVIVATHLGRPKGQVDESLRLKPVIDKLSELANGKIMFLAEVTGPEVTSAVEALQPGEVVALENLRFNPGETSNDPGFAAELAALAEVYVNDAFGASHRAHASIVGVPALLPSAAGFLLDEEVSTLTRLMDDPPRPFVVVLGGSKVADKLGVVKNLLDVADKIIIGGGMCFTFLKARGMSVGRSLVDESSFMEVSSIAWDDKLLLPFDIMAGQAPADDGPGDLVRPDSIPDDLMGLDIGPESAASFARQIADAQTVFWNGPMGVFENPAYAGGTRTVAFAVAQADGYTVIGGGDTAAALSAFALDDEVDFMSTGGGASLEFLEGTVLPGVEALQSATERTK